MSDTKKSTKRTAPFSMRLDPDLRAALQALADADERSFTNYVEVVLKKHVASKERKRDDRDHHT